MKEYFAKKVLAMNMDICRAWSKDKDKNPLTGRRILQQGQVGKTIEKLCQYDSASSCNSLRENPSRNPLTKRALNPNAKGGVYTQLKRFCEFKLPTNGKNNARQRLLSAIQKHFRPLLSKANTIQTRLAFAKLVRGYVADLKPCLVFENGKLTLVNSKDEPVVTFDKRIGSDSVFGTAYLNMGKGFKRLLKFLCKLMDETLRGSFLERDLCTLYKKLNMK